MLIAVTIAISVLINPQKSIQPPSCLLELYGCVYYIWDHEDGTADALVTCDRGSTFTSYSGRFGGCP